MLWVTLRELDVLPQHFIFFVDDLRLSTAAEARLIRLFIYMMGTASDDWGASERFDIMEDYCC